MILARHTARGYLPGLKRTSRSTQGSIYPTNFRASAMSLVALARGASHGSAGSLAATWRARPQLRPLRDYDCSS